ncbi:MFS transporter [Streptomyces clavuligerus]|uniref:Efflux protein QacA n=1 Tax=Streptomyces clavuligerus TaxID=1901 RepID=B5GMK8_STRCL|nr:MFS transporter [Streptomyces clavuligerus]ANW22407.1 transmembrane-transporter [Streptomyces clavuligerus]AXU17312.1 MFS transporter [Streptomyces clavuligerus]EDY47554.1 transmembrane-transport protein [Streptomyces clavuligerus]EFG04512.1 efflux protein QacA [Streptomyces clavuligerus]MBY6307038.1 MFS transporter [Streptomyces clavuligerus]
MYRPAAIPDADRVHARRWIVLTILSGSLLLIAMDTTILNVAFPSLVADLQPGSVEQLWIIDAYALALSGLLVTAGALGDRWGRKRLLLSGFALFAAASLGAVFATEAWHVIAARALLGVGGAAIMPATLSILRHVFTDARERAFAYAVWAAVMGGGMALGPVVGGLLVENHGWTSAFLLNIPIALAVIGFGAWLLPESFAPSAERWDWTGVVQSVVGMIALAAGIKQLGKSGLNTPLPWLLLAIAAVVLTLFVRRQLRLAHPLLQVRLFTSRAFSVSALALFLGMIALGAVLFLLTQWFQYAQGYSPLQAGLRVLPAPLALMVASLLAPALMRTLPIRHVMGTGLVAMAAGLALPWLAQDGDGHLGYPVVATALALIGLGSGVAMTVASVTLMAATPTEHVSGAAAIEETCYELGAALGVASLGSLAGALYRSDLPASVPEAARDSVGEAAYIAQELGGTDGASLLEQVARAFTHGMTPAFALGGVLALAAAAAVWAWIPRGIRPTENAH